MSSLKKLAGQTALYGISSILGRFINWALTPLFTKFLDPADFGVMTDLYAWTTYFLVILTFGMETSYFRFTTEKDKIRDPYKDSFLFVGAMGTGFFLFTLITFKPLAGVLDYGDRPILVLLTAGIILLDVLCALPMAKLRMQEKAKLFVTITLINIFVNVFLNILFIRVMGLGVEYIFISNLIASGIKLALCLNGGLPENFRLEWKEMRVMTSYGFYIMLAGLLGMMVQNIEKNMMSHFWEDGSMWHEQPTTGKYMLGLYSAGTRMAMIVALITQAYRYAMEPFFFRHSAETQSRVIFGKVFHYYWILSMVVFLFIATFAREIASFSLFGYHLIGKKYWAGLDVVPLMLIAYSLFGAYTHFSIWFKMTRQPRFGLLFSLVGALIVITGNVLSISKFGYMGSAVSAVAGFGVMTILVYLSGQNYYPVPYKTGRAFFNSALFLGAYLVANNMTSEAGRVFLCFSAVIVCYVVDRTAPLNWKEEKSA
jgi:O-antigen/teichoic acid export membrane protein